MAEQNIPKVNQIIDAHHDSIEDELQEILRTMDKRLVSQNKKHYEPLIQGLERQVEEQRLKTAGASQRQKQLANEETHTEKSTDKFLDMISDLKNHVKTVNDKSRIFKAWAKLAIGRDIMEELGNQIYLKEPLKRIMFKRWVRKMRRVKSQRQKRMLKRQLQQEVRTRETEDSQRIVALQSELSAVRHLLEEHEKQAAEVEAKLRRAFMRGVVNLNIEAMDVFGEVPTADTFANGQAAVPPSLQEEDDEPDFYVEPAPRISVIRHR